MPKEYDDTLDDTVLITHDPETGRPISNDTAVSEPTSTRGRARSKETVPLAPERDRPSDNSDDDDARRQRRVRQQQFREQRTSATYGRVRFFGIVCFVFGLTPLGIGIYSLVSVEEDRRHNWREQTCEIVPSTLTHDHCVFYTLRHKSEESCGIVAHFATHGGWNTAPGCRDANYDDFPSIKYWRELSVAGNGTTTPCWVPKHTIDPKTCAIAAVREKSLSNFLWDNNEHFVFVSRNPEDVNKAIDEALHPRFVVAVLDTTLSACSVVVAIFLILSQEVVGWLFECMNNWRERRMQRWNNQYKVY